MPVVDGFTGMENSTDATIITVAIASAGSTFKNTGNFSLSVTPLTEWFVNTVELGPLNNTVAIVGGTPLTDAGGTRSWRRNLLQQEAIFLTFTPAPTTTAWSVGFYFKTDLTGANPGTLYDAFMVESLNTGAACIFQLIDGNPPKFDLETSSSIGTKHFPASGLGIAIQTNHIYWGTVKFDSAAGVGSIGCYDPAAGWTTIGQGTAAVSTTDQTFGKFRFGGAQHGSLVNSNIWYDCAMYDVTTAAFPLGYGGGGEDINRVRAGILKSGFLSDNPNPGGQF